MSFSAKIIADSITKENIRLTTFLLRYPRFIHAELMTHRVFSRNASSSRAIPVLKIIDDVLEDPATPVHWGKNQSGMQAFEELDEPSQLMAKAEWQSAMYKAVDAARALAKIGAHKQLVNRILEPFAHITVVVTSTNFANFFSLRSHPDAQPEIKVLSDMMKDAYQNSRPDVLHEGEWHLPFVTYKDFQLADVAVRCGTYKDIKKTIFVPDILTNLLIRVSVARCARTSYTLHDGKETTFEADIALYDRLLASEPLHASPAEHQATPDFRTKDGWFLSKFHGNLKGFVQYRKLLPGEFVNG